MDTQTNDDRQIRLGDVKAILVVNHCDQENLDRLLKRIDALPPTTLWRPLSEVPEDDRYVTLLCTLATDEDDQVLEWRGCFYESSWHISTMDWGPHGYVEWCNTPIHGVRGLRLKGWRELPAAGGES